MVINVAKTHRARLDHAEIEGIAAETEGIAAENCG
jgi:hypothetical protein